jgi:hypothetical protein
MYYGTTTRGTGLQPEGWSERLIRSILFFIPPANPDNAPLYPRVSQWLLEIDEDGHPFREIGLDEHGKPLFGAPNDRNFGFFTDSDATFAKTDLNLVRREEFEKQWQSLTGDKTSSKRPAE